MKKLMLLVMLLLTVCSSAFAESIDDVLKDCKLDRNRWKVVEWSKADHFVRFYDSDSVSVTGPGQFEVIINDYYYGSTCRKDNCAQLGSKHYHIEKWGFNTAKATGTLRSFSLKDANQETVDAYEYPTSMQIATDINKKSIEAKTVLKIKDSLKNDKEFTKEVKPKQEPVPQNTAPLPKITGLVPMPMAIGASDGEWTYMGRFIQQNSYPSFFEWETRMRPYTGTTESTGLYDVYFNHRHGASSSSEEFLGCEAYETGFRYGCVIKIVPLDSNGRRYNLSGTKYGTYLLTMSGASKGTFAAWLHRIRVFDNVTHQMLINVTSREDSSIMGNFRDYDYNIMMNVRESSPYYTAMRMSNCPK